MTKAIRSTDDQILNEEFFPYIDYYYTDFSYSKMVYLSKLKVELCT